MMNRRFLLGCIGGLLIFIAINLLAAHLSSDCGLPAVFRLDSCADDITRAGWPLQFYEEGGFAYRSIFTPLLFTIDITIGIAVAVLTGWFYARSKKSPPK